MGLREALEGLLAGCVAHGSLSSERRWMVICGARAAVRTLVAAALLPSILNRLGRFAPSAGLGTPTAGICEETCWQSRSFRNVSVSFCLWYGLVLCGPRFQAQLHP